MTRRSSGGRVWAGVALLASACAPAGERALERVYDPCATWVLAVEASPEEVGSLDEALRLWNEAAGLHLSRDGVGSPLEIRFIPTLPALFGVYDDRAGTILVNRLISDPRSRAVVIAHELGHAFGMRHAPDDEAPSLMRAANTTVPPTSTDALRLRGLWGDCRGAGL